MRDTTKTYKNLKDQNLSLDDIAARKLIGEELLESKNYLEKLISHANAPIVVWNPRHEIIQFNHAFEQFTGYMAGEIIGKKFSLLFPEQSVKETLENIFKSAEGENRQIIEVPIACKNGKQRILLWSSANIYNNYYNHNKKTLIATIAQGQDITELKSIDKAKSEFISLVAHQLRMPLSTISLTTEGLMHGAAGKINDKTRQYLQNILTGIKSMTEMIDTFLNISKIEMGVFPIYPVANDLIRLVDDFTAEILPQISAKRLIFKKNYFTEKLEMNLDAKALRVILENLFSNAIKYTEPGGSITVDIINAKKEIIVKISDNGKGIPKDQQAKIFEKSFRAENIKNIRTEGLGLGLYTVKLVISQTNGKIWFESEENQGTTFYVAFPKAGMSKKENVSTV